MPWSTQPGTFGLILIREPTGQCDVCEVPFYSHRDTVAHLQTPEHREAAEARIAERQAEKKRLAFLHDDPDPEVTAHLKEVGKRMRKEGRWVVKKNERAGFS
jgi:hypothetical protein